MNCSRLALPSRFVVAAALSAATIPVFRGRSVLSSFRRAAETSTLEARAPWILRLRVNFCAALDEFFPLFLHS